MTLPALVLALLVGVALGAGSFTFYYAEGTSYLSNDPRSCVNCHIMRDHYDGWQKASHHHVAVCNDCHTPHNLVGKYVIKAENGFWHSKAFTLQDFHDPIIIRSRNRDVLQGACIDCHKDFVASIADHGSGADTLRCVHCHASVGHGPPR